MTTHYSSGLDVKALSKSARAGAQALIELCKNEDLIPILIYTGLSGISNATMISYYLHEAGLVHNLVYVRKEFENSHGKPIEHNLSGTNTVRLNTKRVIVFVDDFVGIGDTRRRCIAKFLEFMNYYNMTTAANCQFKIHEPIYQLLEEQRAKDNGISQLKVFVTVERFKNGVTGA